MWKLRSKPVKPARLSLMIVLSSSALLIIAFLCLASPLTRFQDNHRTTAEKAFAEGGRLQAIGSAEFLRVAIKKNEEAILSWKAAGDSQGEARTLKNVGEIYQLLGEPQAALKHYAQALSLRQKLDDLPGKGEILAAIGSVYLLLGEKQKALEHCSQALIISQAAVNRRGEAQALNNIGEIHYGSGNLQQSLEFYQRALLLWRELGDRHEEARPLLNCGYIYSDLGEPQNALSSYQQALSLWRAVKDHRGQALTLTALGRLYSRLGESQEALSFFNQARQLIPLLGDRIEEARILNGIGYVYEVMGEQQRAIEYYHQALSLFRAASYRIGETVTFHEIGRAYYFMGHHQEALDYFQCFLSMSQALADQRFVAHALIGIGMVGDSMGRAAEALKYYDQALPIYQAEDDRRGEAFTLNLIGRARYAQGQWRAALNYYQRALRRSQEAGDQVHESLTRYNIARTEHAQHRPRAALKQIEAALRVVESLRTKVASNDLRASYFASIQKYYELDIDLLMRQSRRAPSGNFVAAALAESERARMRSLLDLLAEARTDIRQDGDPVLIQRARTLQQQINAQAERKTRLLNAKATQEEIAAVVKEIGALTTEREQLEAQIRVQSPRYAAIAQPQPLSLQEIQQLLDDDTVLLEYSLGSERSYLWAVTRTGLRSYELPGRAEIEKLARPVYDLLSQSQFASAQTERQREAEYWRRAAALSNQLLKPVAGQLGAKRLLIVADGILQYIPFAALPKPHAAKLNGKSANTNQANIAQFIPLIVEHEIVNLPSASTLAVLRREMACRQTAPKTIAVLADPVFENDDLRLLAALGKVASLPASQVAINQPPTLHSGRLTRDGLTRLWATRHEARAIEEVTTAAERFVAEGFAASRAQATDAQLSQYRIIHFATHGVLDSEYPELSAIVLSQFDQQGNPQDGYLRLHDIYNLKLPAELVVLSACNTGLGKEIKGEGLIGLTRGFMYAGASRVMASLWKVEDAATAKLMRHFYQHMLKEGLPPAAALRRAQVALWQDAQSRAPYYWAAFVIQGEWR